MFQINETILYGTQGVCKIEAIEQKELNGRQAEYYVLKPVYQANSTIFVPVNSEPLTAKMRRILSLKELKELIRLMPDEDTIWIDDDSARKERYRQIIASGDRKKLVQLIKTLYARQDFLGKAGKKLHQSDEQLFKRAENLLYNEFALVLNIKPEQVIPFLNEQIGLETLQQGKI